MICYIKQSVILVTIAFIDISFPNHRFDHESRHFNYPAKTKILHIGGIFPMAGSWAGGRGCRPAVDIALEDVNNRSDILPGFKLKMLSNDSRCMPGLGMNVLYELLYNDPIKLMLLGPGCSVVSTFVGQAARMWNLVVLSYGSSSPALSSRKRFPTFFRTHPSATLHNPTRIKLFKKFGWTQIATIQETQEVFTSTMEDLEERAKSNGIEIAVRTNFLVDPANAVRNLKRQDARVIVGLFYEDKARRVFCEVYKQKLYGPKYVWFIIGWYADNWFMEPDTNCTVDQMKEALEGHFTTEGLMLNSDNNVTVSGMTAKEFIKQLNKRIKHSVGSGVNPLSVTGYVEAPLAYDAVWALALALNKTQTRLQKRNLSLEQFSYSNKEIMEEIYCAMNSTDFLGVSVKIYMKKHCQGHVAFNSEGDRIALTQIEQMIDGNYTIIGFYDIASDELKWYEKEIWKDGKKPQDRTIIKHYVRVISSVLFATICLLASVGIICSLLLLFFNTIHRNKRVIRMSQPHINNIMLIGCIVCFGCIFVNGLDATYVNNDFLAQICQVRTWMLCIGFTLAYGALFSKVWTIYRLTTRRKVEIKAIKEWEMYIVIVVCLLLDFILMMAWQLIDPMHVHLENFPSERPETTDQDIEILPQLQHCISDHLNIWFGIAFGYKGILLLFGILLAYETRNIKVKQVNDSRFVGMSIYNVVVLCVITVPVTLIISSHQDATFAFVSVAILLSNFLSMGLIFIPKILDVSQMTDDNSSITDTITCSMEDEHHRRLLQENEELKAQIIEKEERIQELKRQLQMKCETNQKRFVSFKDDVVDSRCLLSDDQTNKTKQERSLLPSLCSVDDDDCSKLHSTSKTEETDLEFSDSSDNIFYKSYTSSQSFPRKSNSNKLRTSAITMLTKLSEVTAEERCSESYC